MREIRRYSNRKLYDLSTSGYTSLGELVKLTRANESFVVLNPQGIDITNETLARAFVETGVFLRLPTETLRTLVSM